MVSVILQPEPESSGIATKSNTELAGSITADQEDGSASQPPSDLQSSSGLEALRCLNLEEALRLVDVYNTVVGTLHPILEVRKLRTQIRAVFLHMGGNDVASNDLPSLEEIDCLKMVLAIALMAEGRGHNEDAIGFHENVQPSIVQKILGTKFHLQDQILLVLVVSA